MIASYDDSQRLVDVIKEASNKRRQLSIAGHGTKASYACSTSGDALQTEDHTGIVQYRPDELTISVRAGTPLAVVESALDERNQMLAAEPPRFWNGGSIGGAIACGLSGPARPWRGSLRDAVLGVEIVNGLGERLRFGGSVMKNVAGFDISRLLVGSLGAFGLILSVNLRVHPKPEFERTLVRELDWDDAWLVMLTSLAKPLPVTGVTFWQNALYVRLSGSRASVGEAAEAFPGAVDIDNECWSHLRDHTHHFFLGADELHRAWLPRGKQARLSDSEAALIEWSGAQVWCKDAHAAQTLLEDGIDVEPFARAKVAPVKESKYVKRLRLAFDPHSIFNNDILL